MLKCFRVFSSVLVYLRLAVHFDQAKSRSALCCGRVLSAIGGKARYKHTVQATQLT